MPVYTPNGQALYGRGTVLASAARTTDQSQDLSSGGARGVAVYLNITAAPDSASTLQLLIRFKSPVSGTYGTILAGAILTGSVLVAATLPSFTRYLVFPGCTVTTNKANDCVGDVFNIQVDDTGGESWTYSVGYDLLP